MIDVVELDTMARETVMRQHVEAVTGVNHVTKSRSGKFLSPMNRM
jgi:hypothetical protein